MYEEKSRCYEIWQRFNKIRTTLSRRAHNNYTRTKNRLRGGSIFKKYGREDDDLS
jgi:hypothetical protein